MNEYGNFIRRADLIKNLIARQQLDEETAASKPNKAIVDANKQRWFKYQELLRDSLTARIAAANSSGGTPSGGGALLLDTYSGSAAAYSVARRLSSTYTGALIRVRRSSDNTEQDIGYNALNRLDESALTTFVGAGNGFVTTWYDQSGNGLDSTQSTAISQPQIVSSGTILTQSSKPKISWVSTKWMTAAIPTATRRDIYFITNNDSDTSWLYPDDFGGNSSYGYVAQSGSASTNLFYNPDSTPSLYVNNALQSPTTRDNVYTALNGYKLVGHENFRTNLTGLWNAFNIGKYTGFEFGGSFQEIIIYNSNQSANRTGINTNINTFYTIY
jgi:hypothetical protein